MRNNGTMRAHIQSRIGVKNIWRSGFRCLLAVRAAQVQEAFCAFDLGSHRGERHDCLRNSSARALGILSVVIVLVLIMENEVRFFWWLFLFHLRLTEECAIEGLVPAHGLCKALRGLLFDDVASEAAGSRCLLAATPLCSHLNTNGT